MLMQYLNICPIYYTVRICTHSICTNCGGVDSIASQQRRIPFIFVVKRFVNNLVMNLFFFFYCSTPKESHRRVQTISRFVDVSNYIRLPWCSTRANSIHGRSRGTQYFNVYLLRFMTTHMGRNTLLTDTASAISRIPRHNFNSDKSRGKEIIKNNICICSFIFWQRHASRIKFYKHWIIKFYYRHTISRVKFSKIDKSTIITHHLVIQ